MFKIDQLLVKRDVAQAKFSLYTSFERERLLNGTYTPQFVVERAQKQVRPSFVTVDGRVKMASKEPVPIEKGFQEELECAVKSEGTSPVYLHGIKARDFMIWDLINRLACYLSAEYKEIILILSLKTNAIHGPACFLNKKSHLKKDGR